MIASMEIKYQPRRFFNRELLATALISFVGSFDLMIFNLMREVSLTELGVIEPFALLRESAFLLNMQLLGFLVGGLVWGKIGDNWGRKSTLGMALMIFILSSIMLYKVNSIGMYDLLRFISGFGTAGLTGVATTLYTEAAPSDKRGYATIFTTSAALLGILSAYMFKDVLNWRQMFLVIGLLSSLIFLVQRSLKTSAVFKEIEKMDIDKGSFSLFFTDSERMFRLLRCIVIGIPTWFVYAIITTFGYEIAREKNLSVDLATLALVGMVASTIGDIGLTSLSQYIRSRRAVLVGSLLMGYLFLYLTLGWASTAMQFYVFAGILSMMVNFCGVIMITTAEQFGTNIRTTAITFVANFIRASAVIILLSFSKLNQYFTFEKSGMIIGITVITIALISAVMMEESAKTELSFIEK